MVRSSSPALSSMMTKTKKHHDGAGVDDDLGGGEELGPERPVEDGQRHHDDDQREGAVDGVALQEEVECSCDGQRAKDDEECQLHDVPLSSFVSRRDFRSFETEQKFSGYLLIVKQLAWCFMLACSARIEAGDDDVGHGKRQQKLPAEAHELVVTEAGQRAAHPDVEQKEAQNLDDKPEDRKDGVRRSGRRSPGRR